MGNQGSTAKPGERRESRINTNTGAHAVASRISDGRAGEARSLARVCVVRGAWQHRVSPLRPSRPALGPASPRHGAAKERTISLTCGKVPRRLRERWRRRSGAWSLWVTSAAYLRWMLCLPGGQQEGATGGGAGGGEGEEMQPPGANLGSSGVISGSSRGIATVGEDMQPRVRHVVCEPSRVLGEADRVLSQGNLQVISRSSRVLGEADRVLL